MAKKQNYRLIPQNSGRELTVISRGQALIHNPLLNKGTAFPEEERKVFGLDGLLPPYITVIEDQYRRILDSISLIRDDIEKYNFLRSLQDRNETLFYYLVSKNIRELLPIIYTPTVGEAVRKYGQIFRTTRGLFVTPYNIDRFDELAGNVPSGDIDMIVVTDNQGILGIGDQGVGGMAICIGKLSIYTAAAGFAPSTTLPVTLDVGTDNEELLNDPHYLGIREKRITGKAYEEFIEKFVAGVKRNFPGAVLQWEDFSKQNAFTNMDRYREVLPSFNDDIQGTAAVTLGGIYCALKIKKEKISEQKILIFGAGAAGIGIARQIHDALVSDGLAPAEAMDRLFIVDSRGLILSDRNNLDEYKKEFARSRETVADWTLSDPERICMAETVRNAGITVLIGVSGQPGSFTSDIIDEMLIHTPEPVIFPLSNPTSLAEADPREILKYTNGRAIVAAGSPFGNVTVNDMEYEIGQGNNAFIFPGVGLGAVASRAKSIPFSFFTVAANALADAVSEERLARRCVYPAIDELNNVSVRVAVEVFNNSLETGLGSGNSDAEKTIRAMMWKPEYVKYIPEA